MTKRRKKNTQRRRRTRDEILTDCNIGELDALLTHKDTLQQTSEALKPTQVPDTPEQLEAGAKVGLAAFNALKAQALLTVVLADENPHLFTDGDQSICLPTIAPASNDEGDRVRAGMVTEWLHELIDGALTRIASTQETLSEIEGMDHEMMQTHLCNTCDVVIEEASIGMASANQTLHDLENTT